MNKECTKCCRMMPVQDFSKRKRGSLDGLHSHCKSCRAAYRRELLDRERACREDKPIKKENTLPSYDDGEECKDFEILDKILQRR